MKYRVRVKFNKDFLQIDEDKREIVIGIKSKPVKGRANEEILKKLARHFHMPSSKVRIVGGMRSKRKVVEIKA
jgi:uncharacterized protein (TIGR00251 family)